MLVIGVVVFVLAFSGTVAAIGDDTGDVWHFQETNGGWSWDKYSGEKPNIDITDVSYSIDGTQATVTMEVRGEIETSADITYMVHLESDDGEYIAYYNDGEAMIYGEGEFSGFYEPIDDPVSGDTFTATFEVENPDASYELWGAAAESPAEGSEEWGDYAPSEYAPWDSGDDDTDDGDTDDGAADGGDDGTGNGGDGTPGFEVPFVLLAMLVAGILLVKRKEL
ncbi:MAG: hypothetical protein R6U10_08110 [Thermoplasmatota archaeon]